MPRTPLALLVVALAAGAARAEPVVVKPGKHVLPMSGLEIELPKDKRKGFTWSASASYALTNEGLSFDGRDVIDAKVDDKLVGGTWVHVGFFDVGTCDKVVEQADLTSAWTHSQALFGVTWAIRGGVFTFDGSLGKVPTTVLCTERKDRKALLVYQFFIGEPETMPREAMLEALAKVELIGKIAASWEADRSVAVETRKRAEVRDRGQVAAVREAKLARSGITITLPDDGFVWLVRKPDDEDVVDWIERMAPSLPEVEIEVLRVPDDTCKGVFDGITSDKRTDTPPKGLPDGWIAGPTLVVDGRLERTMCRQSGEAAVIVGVFVSPESKAARDMKPFVPLLDAIRAGADAVK